MSKQANNDRSNIILCKGLPVDYGVYLFILSSGVIREGMYDSYAYPIGTAIKVCYDYAGEYFTYYNSSEILGYIQKKQCVKN